jgi:hypothetical protein
MSEPSADLMALGASMSSSGFTDGLGRRTLAFDREEGTMLERLVLRPELAAFEKALRERIDRVAAMEDERIARPRTIERDADGALVVVSEFVPGSRLSDLLEVSANLGNAPGVDAALGYLLDVLPALCGLHAGAGFAHGTIAPSRTVLTPAGQVVLLDAIYGDALSHLRYGRRKLWTDFAIAAPAVAGAARLDAQGDIAQVALAALMLVLGRPLGADDFPDRLPNLLEEVVEIAQIRGTAAFADGVLDFFQRALPLSSAGRYATADDALIDVRGLARELGLHACRRALVDFIQQMEPAAPQIADGGHDEILDEIASFGVASGYEIEEEESIDGQFDEPLARRSADREGGEHDLESGVDAEIDLEALVDEPPCGSGDVTEIEMLSEPAELDDPLRVDWHEERREELQQEPEGAAAHAEPAARLEVTPADTGAVVEAPEEETAATQPAAESSVRSRRAKRSRSTRARKDRLRSASTPSTLTSKPAVVEAPPAPAPAPPSPPPPPPPEPEPESTWLVPPDRAAAFEPAVPDTRPPAPAAPFTPPAPPAFALVPGTMAPGRFAPVMPPPVAAADAIATPRPGPIGVPEPAMAESAAWPPPPPAPPAADLARPQSGPVKLKEAPKKPRGTRAPAPAESHRPPAPVAADAASGGRFPWKSIAAVLALIADGGGGGRAYFTDGPASSPSDAVAPAPEPPKAAAAIPPAATTNGGRLEIETQPAGARVLLDGKPAGETPLAIDGVSAGRHTVTLVSSSGSVKRTVRVEAGRTAKLDVPIFSGWVGIFAPFVVSVSEGGTLIGTTEEPRLMLGPGRHVLTLTNADLGHQSVHTVDVVPGEVKSITIDPRGTMNLNASPWAEVWMDGKKLGDTPIANLELPLGIREVIFRHPQLGERRVPITVRSKGNAPVSVDMNKP